MASVTLKNIYKIYSGGVTAVTDFNLDIEDGIYHSGRPLWLRQVHHPAYDRWPGRNQQGRTVHRRCALNDIAPKDRDIAMVFQNYALYPHT